MENAFDELIRLDTAEEKSLHLRESPYKPPGKKSQNRISKNCRTTTKGITLHVMGIPYGEERKKKIVEKFETIMTEDVPKLMSEMKHIFRKLKG